MGETISITSSDGFEFDAYKALPSGDAKGGVVVIQEIFGVNPHIREVADGYAKQGYAAIAPAIFDRVEKGVELGYDDDGMQRGIEIAFNGLEMSNTLQDLAASAAALQPYGKVGAVGYCFGGLLAYLSACQLDNLACSVGYYGGGIVNALDQEPKVPLMLHFGELDAHIPLDEVEKIKAAKPNVPVHVYDGADHGFNCSHRPSYNAEAAALALKRTLAFFAEHL